MADSKSSFLTSVILGSSLALGGCLDSSSDSSSQGNSDTSRFEFKVHDPSNGQLASSFMGRSAKQLMGMLIPEAHAALGDQNIQVAIVDYDGVVIQLVTPTEPLQQEADGTYVVILEGGVRLDCVLLVTLDGPSDIKVGDRIDETGALYTPTVDTSAPLDIDLASTIAFDLFIEEVESFDNITPSEVDTLIEGAQKIINDLGVTAVDTEALTELISAELTSYVKTETLLAELSDESEAGEQVSSGSIETDRAKIKGFFDDINTLAVVLPGKFEGAEGDSALNNIKADADVAQAVLEGASATLDDLASLQATLQAGLETFEYGATEVSIAEIFAGDEKASLTGVVSFSDAAGRFTIDGSYGRLTVVNLEVAVDFSSTTNKPFSFTLAGKVASPEATVELIGGVVELHSSASVATLVLAEDQTPEQVDALDAELADKLIAANAALTIHLAVHKDGQDLSTFTGSFAIEAVRSSNDYIEFSEDDAEAFYNLKSIELEGRFTQGDNTLAAKVSAKQNNAADYTPLTQELVEGTVYNNLYSYDYNGSDTFVFHGPDEVTTLVADASHEYKVLRTARPYYYEESLYADSFTAQMESKNFYFYGIGGVRGYFTGSELDKGEEQTIPLEGIIGTYSYSDTSLSISYENNYGQTSVESYELDTASDDGAVIKRVSYTVSVDMHASTPEEHLQSSYYDGNYGFHIYSDDIYAYYEVKVEDLERGTDLTITAQLDYAYSYSDGQYVSDSQPQTLPVTYTFTDEHFVITTPGDDNEEILFLGVEEYTGLNITSSSSSEYLSAFAYPYYVSVYTISKGTFAEFLDTFFLNNLYNSYAWPESVGWVALTYPELSTGEGIAIPAEVRNLRSLKHYENATNFREFTFAVELENNIAGIGETLIKASLERTGYRNGVVILSLSHTDDNSLLSDVNIMATYNGNELGSMNISNSDGFVISRDDVLEGDEETTITFGLETATVSEVDSGIKVSYSNGEFDLY